MLLCVSSFVHIVKKQNARCAVICILRQSDGHEAKTKQQRPKTCTKRVWMEQCSGMKTAGLLCLPSTFNMTVANFVRATHAKNVNQRALRPSSTDVHTTEHPARNTRYKEPVFTFMPSIHDSIASGRFRMPWPHTSMTEASHPAALAQSSTDTLSQLLKMFTKVLGTWV